MIIREMGEEECFQVLAEKRLARLACAKDNQPYVVPVYLVFDRESECLYGFTTPGRKVEWLRANPLVCVEMDHVAGRDQWVSLVVDGCYEELTESESHFQRARAWELLKANPFWWEPGMTRWGTRGRQDPSEPYPIIYYRIRIDHLTGHEATRSPGNPVDHVGEPPPDGIWSWLQRQYSRIVGGARKGTRAASRPGAGAPEPLGADGRPAESPEATFLRSGNMDAEINR